MKTAIFASLCLGSFAHAMEVHEWGTFTVLSGSNGMQVPWYQGSVDVARLPAFIHPSINGKSGSARIRMETPVIYFYPEKETRVTVGVSFLMGEVTETFPHSLGYDPATRSTAGGHQWAGVLHPPADKAALAEIPTIPASQNPEPYGAAREVPDAWIFESDLREIPGLKEQPHFPQMEKFIFYRGTSDAYLPISATMAGNDATLTNMANGTVGFGTALRVRDGKAAWVEVPALHSPSQTGEPTTNSTCITLPEPARPLDEVESELADAWKKALAADGLTPAEASAMVETWRKTWFRESGDRILALVPRRDIDAMLPLNITPAPAKIERVFVARIEMLCPDREERLLGLLTSTAAADASQVAELEKLALGRFANGSIQIASNVQSQRMWAKYHSLQGFAQSRGTSAR